MVYWKLKKRCLDEPEIPLLSLGGIQSLEVNGYYIGTCTLGMENLPTYLPRYLDRYVLIEYHQLSYIYVLSCKIKYKN